MAFGLGIVAHGMDGYNGAFDRRSSNVGGSCGDGLTEGGVVFGEC